MRIIFSTIIVVIVFFVLSQKIYSESSYILPYPSSMPGNKFYKINLIWDDFKKFWYFGSFGQFKYNLQQSDKFIVEAKTLFEYHQYLLGYNALKKSDYYFIKLRQNLLKAKSQQKNITQNQSLLNEASGKHIETLEQIVKSTPSSFVWQPEKALPTTLDIKRGIENAINIRKNDL